MLSSANHSRHKKLKEHLENQFTIDDTGAYPKTTTRLLSLMNNFRAKEENRNRTRRNPGTGGTGDEDEDGINFMQHGGDDNNNNEANNNNDDNNNQQGLNMLC